MKDLNIEIIKKYIETNKILWTNHSLNRINQRNISIIDVKMAIKNGAIIEYYYNDYPYPSCLIIGNTKKNELLHVVCGIGDERVYIITAYNPNSKEWDDDMKIRRNK